MTGAEWVAIILTGGLLIPGGVFLLATGLVYLQSDPQRGRDYLEAHRARKAAEGTWQDVEVELPRTVPTVRRRPVAAITATPDNDTRWSVLAGRRS